MRKDVVTSTDATQLEAEPLDKAAQVGEGHIGRSSTAKVQHLPPNSYSATVLTDLAHSRAELQAVIHAVRRHGIAYARLPRSLVISFLKANSGCGHIRLRQPIIG